MNYLPEKLLKLRKHYNYSQSYLAETLGVDVLKYMGYENGREIINYAQAKKLASLYHVPIVEMLENSNKVTLYNVSDAHTDEINIEYFLPKKTFIQKFIDFCKKRPYIPIGATCVLIGVVVLLLLPNNNSESYIPVMNDLHRLSANETSLIYIDENGAVKGSGDNANSQLSNLPSKNAIKVQEGNNFSVILLDDGTLITQGISSKNQELIDKWENIIDIAVGDKHIVAVDKNGDVYASGDNSAGQLDVSGWKKIEKIFATPTGTIGINSEGTCYYTGSFLGTSLLRNSKDIVSLNASHENIIVLKEDGTVEYMANNDKVAYIKTMGWKDVIDVACGNDFFAALKKDGTVMVAIENDKFEEIVTGWNNIIAIDAYDNYLVAYDGLNIYGAGKNDYHQFDDGKDDTQTLPPVKNVEVKIENSFIRVQFDPVANCDFYQVTLNVGTGISKKVSSKDLIEFDTALLEEDDLYTITIVSLGDDETYEDSKPFEYTFTYIPPGDKDIVTTRNDILGMNRIDLENYLISLGINPENIESILDEGACMNDEEIVINIEGIEPNKQYSREEIENMFIKYKYCKLDSQETENSEN